MSDAQATDPAPVEDERPVTDVAATFVDAVLGARADGADPGAPLPAPDRAALIERLRGLTAEFSHLRLISEFGIDEVLTKIDILRREFEQTHDYSPIEHVRSRLKSIDSLIEKAGRLGLEPSLASIRAQIFDVAGIRITCSFESDVYWIASMLQGQPDIELMETRDYIAHPKPNGYRSLHLIIRVPVSLSTHTEYVTVELQLRTIAMDFWASVEHKLKYKYRQDLPAELAAELDSAARLTADLDERMGRLREEIRPIRDPSAPPPRTPWTAPGSPAPRPRTA